MTEEQKQKARERARIYYQKNKAKILARQKEYHREKYNSDEEYKNKCLERCRKYREENPEKFREIRNRSQKKYYEKYKDYRKEYYKEYNKKYYETHKTGYQEKTDRINKAIKYMEHYIEVEDAPLNERIKIEFEYVIDILRGEE